MIDPDQQPTAVVPYWAMGVVRDVAEIKARVDAIPELTRKVDAIEAGQVRHEDFEQLRQRTDRLWDSYQRLKGAAWLLGGAEAILALYVAAHAAHLVG